MVKLRRHVLLSIAGGVAGAIALSGLYLGLVSLAESPAHALDLFWEDRFFVIPILLGFGTQVGLFTLLKIGPHSRAGAPAAGATTAAGGGLSSAAMAACCAHHVADVLPFVGLTAAATFLAAWKIPFLIVGLAMNGIGILVMLRELRRARRRAPLPSPAAGASS